MHFSIARLRAPLVVFSTSLCLALIVACGATSPSSNQDSDAGALGGGSQALAFTVTATKSEVVSGGHTTLAALDADGKAVDVTWSLPPDRGAIDDNNVYAAPILFKAEDVAIVASRVDHPEVSVTTTLHVLNVLPDFTSNGGPVLAKPIFTAISFEADLDPAGVETIVSKLGPSAYWRKTTKEYGVEAASATSPVRLAENAPASVNDEDIATWLAGKLDGSHPEFPAPVDGSVYVISYPSTTAMTFLGDASCRYFAVYHSEAKVAGKSVPYVVVTHCTFIDVGSYDRVITDTLIDTVVDPFPFTAPAFDAVDAAHVVWAEDRGSEPNGLCVIREGGATANQTELPFNVGMTWSAAAAAAGHDPCVPSNGPFIAAFPILEDDVDAAYPTTSQTPVAFTGKTKGIAIPVGASKTIDVVVYSDGPPSLEATFSFTSYTQLKTGKPYFKGELTPTTGKNGDHLSLKITTLLADPTYGGQPFLITASLPDESQPPGYAGSTTGLVRISP